MFSRFLARLISGNLSFGQEPRKKTAPAGGIFARLTWVISSLLRKTPDAPVFRLNQRLLFGSIVSFVAIVSGSYFSYRIHTQDLPELLSKQANESKARSDFQSEVNWIAKYLMVIGQADTKEKMAGQTRFAIAVDSQLRQKDELSGTSNIFLAIRQLEAIDALIEETPEELQQEWIQHLNERYNEAADLLITRARRQTDPAMQDSIFGQSLDLIDKGMRLQTANRNANAAGQELRKYAIKSAIVRQLINSPATLAMRNKAFEQSSTISNNPDLLRQYNEFALQDSVWFDDALRQCVEEDAYDQEFYSFLLSHRDNENYPWRSDETGTWDSNTWKELPSLLLARKPTESNPSTTLFDLRLTTVTGATEEASLIEKWRTEADLICDHLEPLSESQDYDDLPLSDRRAQAAILLEAWNGSQKDDVDANQRWWDALVQLLEKDSDEALTAAYLQRAQRHLAEADADSAKPWLNQAIDLHTPASLTAHDLRVSLAALEITQSESEVALESGSTSKRVLDFLDQYQAEIQKQKKSLAQKDIPETDFAYQFQALNFAVHELNHEVQALELKSLTDHPIRTLSGFSRKLDRSRNYGANAAFQIRMTDRVAKLLLSEGLLHDTAMLYEDLLQHLPKDPAVRTRCFDSWYRAGNESRARTLLSDFPTTNNLDGEARLLFLSTLAAVPEDGKREALGTLREQAELLQIRLLELSPEERNGIQEATPQIVNFVLAMIPPEGQSMDGYLASETMRERIYSVAKSAPNNPWIYGVAHGLLQFESPERRENWFSELEQTMTISPIQKRIQQATAGAITNRYWLAIRILLSTNSTDPTPSGSVRVRAAEYARIASGYDASTEILMSIPTDDHTANSLFAACLNDIHSLRPVQAFLSYDDQRRIAIAKRLSENQERLKEIESNDGKFSKLISLMEKFYLKVSLQRDTAQRNQGLEALSADLKGLNEEHPGWKPLCSLSARVAMAQGKNRKALEFAREAIQLGVNSIEDYEQMIGLLESEGRSEEAKSYQKQRNERLNQITTIWTNYLTDNPALREPFARLSHCKSLCRTHATSESFFLLADAALDLTTRRLNPSRIKQLLETAIGSLEIAGRNTGTDSLRFMEIQHRLAIIQRDGDLGEEIIARLEKRAETDPRAGDILAICFQRLGRTRDQLDTLLKANDLSEQEDRYYNIAQCQNVLGLQEEAKASLTKALESYPESIVAKQNLASFIKTETEGPLSQSEFMELFTDGSSSDVDQLAYARFTQSVAENPSGNPEVVESFLEIAESESPLANTAAGDLLRYSSSSIRAINEQGKMTPMRLSEALNRSCEILLQGESISDPQFESYALAKCAIRPPIPDDELDSLLKLTEIRNQYRLLLDLKLLVTQQFGNQDTLIQVIDAWSEDILANERMPKTLADAIVSVQLHRAGAHESALARFKTAFEVDPSLLTLHLDILNQMELHAQKLPYIQIALETDASDKNRTFVAKNCIRFLVQSADDSTVAFLNPLLKRFPHHTELVNFASQVGFQRGDHAMAAKHLKHLNTLRPSQPLILNNLAMCLTEIPEQVETAVAYAKQALDLAPNDPSILDTLGVAYLRNSQPEQAVGYIQQAIGIKKEPRYLFHLLLAYEDLGRSQEYQDTRNMLNQISLNVSGLTASERQQYERQFPDRAFTSLP